MRALLVRSIFEILILEADKIGVVEVGALACNDVSFLWCSHDDLSFGNLIFH